MQHTVISRRDSILAMGTAFAGAAAFGLTERSSFAAESDPVRKRSLRVVHLTDIHVQPEKRAAEGLASCLHHVQQLAAKPDLVLTGGDSIMDSLGADDARTQLQWDIWQRVLKSDCAIPVRSCIGNHDVWGWFKSDSKTTGNEPNWGKKRATEMLHLDERYYVFSQGGWQFIVLDSTHQPVNGGGGYTALLDESQFDWLAQTLRDTPPQTPILILSHIPILSASAVMWSSDEGNNFQISRALMHTDCVKLKDLFAKHPNVKVCLSGHLHLLDRVDYNGVTYLCNGAVSGSWWNGRHKDCDEGYCVLDLYEDGTFDHEYVQYGWRAAV